MKYFNKTSSIMLTRTKKKVGQSLPLLDGHIPQTEKIKVLDKK